jgi:hypothetical protein
MDLPPQIAAALASQGGGAGGGDADEGGTPLDKLQDCISDLHTLLVALQDPADVDTATAALRLLTQVQRRMMSQQGQQAGAGRGY